MTDEILTVHRVSKDGGDYCVRCPHCGDILGIEGDDLSEIRGEQYRHNKREFPLPSGRTKALGCDGWLEVAHSAVFVKELEQQ